MPDELSVDDIEKITGSPEPVLGPDAAPEEIEKVANQPPPDEGYLRGSVEYLGASYGVSGDQVVKSGMSWDAALSPNNKDWTQDQYVEFFKNADTKDDKAKQAELKYMEDNRPFLDHAYIPAQALKMLPPMIEAYKGGGIGGIIGGLGGAAVGAAVTRTPQGTAAFAKTGASWGAGSGMWYATSRMEGGEIFKTAILAGSSVPAARFTAVVGAGLSGAVEMFSLKLVPRQFREGVARSILAKTGAEYGYLRKFAAEYVSGLPKEMVLQIGQEELQEVVIQGYAYKLLSMSQDKETQEKLDKAFQEQLASAFDVAMSTGAATIGLGVASRIAGRVYGEAGNIVRGATEDPDLKVARVADVVAQKGLRAFLGRDLSLVDKVSLIKEAFTASRKEVLEAKDSAEGITEEDVQAFKDMSQGEALDLLTSPDKQGEIQSQVDTLRLALRDLRGRTLTPGVAKRIQATEAGIKAQQEKMKEVREAQEALQEGLLDTEPKTTLKAQATVEAKAEPSLADVSAQLDADVADIQAQFKQDTTIVKGRIDKLKSDMADIDLRLNDLEQRLLADTADDKATKALGNKVEGLYRKRMLMDNELMGLQTGFGMGVRDEDTVEVKAGKILQAKAKAVAEAVRQYDAGIKVGGKEVRQEITGVHKALEGFINKAGLQKEDREAFLAKVHKVTTPKQLAKALPGFSARIRAVLEKRGMQAAESRIQAALTAGALKKGGKRPEGKMTPEAQAIRDAIKTFTQGIGDLSTQTEPLFKLKKEGKFLTLEQHAQLYIGMLIGDVSVDNAAGLNRLAALLEEVIVDGRAEFLEKKRLEDERLDLEVAFAKDAVQGNNPVDIRQSESQETANGNGRRWYRMWDGWNSGMAIWDGILKSVTIDSGLEVEAHVLDAFGTSRATESERKLNNEFQFLLHEDLMEATGLDDKKLRRYLREASMVQSWGEYKDNRETPETHEFIGSKLTLMARLAQKHDPERFSNLTIGNKLGDDFWKLVDKALDEKDKKFVEAFAKHYQRMYKAANAVYEQEHGVSLPWNEFYHPSRVEGYDNGKLSELAIDGYEHLSVIPGSAITRTQNDMPLAPMNIYSAAMSHASDWAHYIGWKDAVRANGRLLANEDFRKAVVLKFGAKTYETMMGHHDTFIKNRDAFNDAVNRSINRWRSRMFITVLGLKALQAPVQLMSSFMAQGRYTVNGTDVWVDTSDVFDALVDLTLLKKPYEILGSTELMKSRGVSFEPAIKDMKSSDIQPVDWFVERYLPKKLRPLFMTHSEMVNVAMMPTLIGDRGGIYGGGWALYKKVLAATGDEQAALDTFVSWAENTQQSTDKDKLSLFQKGNAASKIWLDYANAPSQAVRWMVDGYITLHKSKKTPADIGNFATRVLTAGVAIPAMIYAVKQGFVEDDDEDGVWQMLLSALLSNAAAAGFLGDLIEWGVGSTIAAAFDWKKPYAPSSPVLRFGADTVSVAPAIIEALKEEDDEAWTEAFEKGLIPASAYTSLPLGNFYKVARGSMEMIYGYKDADPDLTDLGAHRFLNYPDSVIKKVEEGSGIGFFGGLQEAAQGALEESQRDPEDDLPPEKTLEEYQEEARKEAEAAAEKEKEDIPEEKPFIIDGELERILEDSGTPAEVIY